MGGVSRKPRAQLARQLRSLRALGWCHRPAGGESYDLLVSRNLFLADIGRSSSLSRNRLVKLCRRSAILPARRWGLPGRIGCAAPRRMRDEHSGGAGAITGYRKGRLTSLVRLSYLGPEIVRALLAGSQANALTPSRLLRLSKNLPHDWKEQRCFLGFAA
jgi:hypothetical protein